MLLQAKFCSCTNKASTMPALSDVYFPLIDPNGYPLTTFRDGRADLRLHRSLIDSPYHCAADEYDRRPSRRSGPASLLTG